MTFLASTVNICTTEFYNNGKYSEPTRDFMNILFQIWGNTVLLESFFSKLTYTKTKTRNQMDVQSLKTLEIIREDLVRGVLLEHQKTRKRGKTALSEEEQKIEYDVVIIDKEVQ